MYQPPTKNQLQARLLYIHERLATYTFDELEGFIDHTRDGLAGQFAKFSKRFDKATKGMSKDEIAEYVDIVYDDLALIRDSAPHLNRLAHCVMVFSAFESAVDKLCRLLKRQRKIRKPLGWYLHGARHFLEGSIDVAAWGSAWQWMDDFRVVRNCIAHNGAVIHRKQRRKKGAPKPNPALPRWLRSDFLRVQRFSSQNKGLIRLTRRREIVVTNKFIDRAIQQACEALKAIHAAVEPLYK